MASCRWFEEEGLRLLEEQGSLEMHDPDCQDCAEAMRVYERIKGGIMPPEGEPRPGWKEGVRARIAARRARRRRVWMGVPGALAAAALLVWMVLPKGSEDVFLETVVRSSGEMRSTSASPGDTLELAAKAEDARFVELRLYREDREVILACFDEPPCRRLGQRIEASWELEHPGMYTPVILWSDREIPAPTGSLDEDLGAAAAAGAQWQLGDGTSVR